MADFIPSVVLAVMTFYLAFGWCAQQAWESRYHPKHILCNIFPSHEKPENSLFIKLFWKAYFADPRLFQIGTFMLALVIIGVPILTRWHLPIYVCTIAIGGLFGTLQFRLHRDFSK